MSTVESIMTTAHFVIQNGTDFHRLVIASYFGSLFILGAFFTEAIINLHFLFKSLNNKSSEEVVMFSNCNSRCFQVALCQ